jgi:hypothetical protein
MTQGRCIKKPAALAIRARFLCVTILKLRHDSEADGCLWREQGHLCVKFQDMVYVLSLDILYSPGFASQGSTAVEPWLARSISRRRVCR